VSNETPILLVEDEPDDQFFIVEAFRTNKVMVPIHVLNSASAAIAYLRGEGQYADRTKFALPRLIITDLKMAGGSGFTLLEYLKQDRQWASIPKIVLSNSGERDDIQTAYPLGANCYHKKPSSFAELCKLMKRLYDYWGIASGR